MLRKSGSLHEKNVNAETQQAEPLFAMSLKWRVPLTLTSLPKRSTNTPFPPLETQVVAFCGTAC